MTIRYRLLDNSGERDAAKFLGFYQLNDYAEFMKLVQTLKEIMIEEYVYDIVEVYFNAATNDDYINSIDVYVREP